MLSETEQRNVILFQEIEGLDNLINLESLFLGKNKITKLKVYKVQVAMYNQVYTNRD